MRRDRVAGVRPEPGAVVRVGDRRGICRPPARPAASVGPVRGLLLRYRRATPVRHGRTGAYITHTHTHTYDVVSGAYTRGAR